MSHAMIRRFLIIIITYLSARTLQTRTLPQNDDPIVFDCPIPCDLDSALDRNWTTYLAVETALGCSDRPIVLQSPAQFSSQAPVSSHWAIRACSTFAGDVILKQDYFQGRHGRNAPNATSKKSLKNTALVFSPHGDEAREVRPQFLDTDLNFLDAGSLVPVGQVVGALATIQSLARTGLRNNQSSGALTVQCGNTIVGCYFGQAMLLAEREVVLQNIRGQLNPDSGNPISSFSVQHCGSGVEDHGIFGLILRTSSAKEDLDFIQSKLRNWSTGQCAPTHEAKPNPKQDLKAVSLPRKHSDIPSVLRSFPEASDLLEPETSSALELSNDRPVLSAGSGLYEDRSCTPYHVQPGDSCSGIASQFGVQIQDLERFNRKTWAWSSCDLLWAGINMCVSQGRPPMPVAVEGTQCGPTVPGTKRPPNDIDLATLNPCPLNACCDVWRFCGTTSEFCTVAPNGGPGTTQPGKNSCISNCGTGIVNMVRRVSGFIKVAYFESWNGNRPCLHMNPTQIDSSYTHVHYAFAVVDDNLGISVKADLLESFRDFTRLQGKKRIIVLGGWAQSTEPATYARLRRAVLPAYRKQFARNIADFVHNFQLDGVDIDWEYPGAPDIPGIPSGTPDDGRNLLALLKEVRALLPNKLMSIAAPASFWYLKAYPIAEISNILDYIIYMTYDLNGQWSYGNRWALNDCDHGNCLRSHVNFTETLNSLSMITKAGVATNKIVVGLASYGRSFKMQTSGCWTADCLFTGPASGAIPGRCTGTPGILANAEIEEIIQHDKTARHFEIDDVSSILLYGSDQWVSYIDDANMEQRLKFFKSLDFAGTANWAVDQLKFLPDVSGSSGSGSNPAAVALSDSLDMSWQQVKCTNPAMVDAIGRSYLDPLQYQKYRWDTLKATAAWHYMISEWEEVMASGNSQGPSFLAVLTNIAHAAPLQCENLAAVDACAAHSLCLDSEGTGAGTTLIINALVDIHLFFGQFDAALKTVGGLLDLSFNTFVGTFVPKEKENVALDIIIGLVQFGLQALSGPTFNVWLKDSTYLKQEYWSTNANALAVIKDETGALIGLGANMAKATMDKKASPQEQAKSLLSFKAGQLIDSWRFGLAATHAGMFGRNVTKQATDFMFSMMVDGKLNIVQQEAALSVERRVKRLLFASLLPSAWRFQERSPALLDSGKSCDQIGVGVGDFITVETATSSQVCVNKTLYYLVSVRLANDHTAPCVQGSPRTAETCQPKIIKVETLTGIDKLRSFELYADDLSPP